MEEKDFQRIEQLIGKVVKAEVGKAVKAEIESVTEDMRSVRSDVSSLKEGMAVVRSDVISGKEDIKTLQEQLGGVKEEIKTVQAQLGSFKEEIKEDFRLQVGILSEDFQHKLQLVAEGHQMLSEKMDRIRDEVTGKIDVVAADVAAHRADTEGHKRGYMVRPVREKTERSLRMIACYGKENGRHRIRSHISRRLSLTG